LRCLTNRRIRRKKGSANPLVAMVMARPPKHLEATRWAHGHPSRTGKEGEGDKRRKGRASMGICVNPICTSPVHSHTGTFLSPPLPPLPQGSGHSPDPGPPASHRPRVREGREHRHGLWAGQRLQGETGSGVENRSLRFGGSLGKLRKVWRGKFLPSS
jgi:hypothetical protein